MTVKLTYVTDGRRHLVCEPYSVENLHRMAAELGLGRHWFHAGKHPHYDLPVGRQAEIEARCMLVHTRYIVDVIRSAPHE